MSDDNIVIELVNILKDVTEHTSVTMERLTQIQNLCQNIPEAKLLTEQMNKDLSDLFKLVRLILENLQQNNFQCPGKKHMDEIKTGSDSFIAVIRKVEDEMIDFRININKLTIVPKIMLYSLCGSVLLNVLFVIPQLRDVIIKLIK